MIKLDLGPTQKTITKDLIEDMINWVPRRFRLRDFDKPLKRNFSISLGGIIVSLFVTVHRVTTSVLSQPTEL
ncbi:MAG: hypothetical protein C4B58_16235 [Deltaproteobacteria bacterium]|nr:MAG: hypothetical protein C4B58_16235 [Deltaproteobacteria bacterium]